MQVYYKRESLKRYHTFAALFHSPVNGPFFMIYCESSPKPIPSMYAIFIIFTHIWLIFMVNVGKYTIHGCYGKHRSEKKSGKSVFFFVSSDSQILQPQTACIGDTIYIVINAEAMRLRLPSGSRPKLGQVRAAGKRGKCFTLDIPEKPKTGWWLGCNQPI